MVIKKSSLAIFLLFFSLVNLSFAVPQLFLFTDKTESALGRPIRAELYGISLSSQITKVDIEGLNENFGVITDYVSNDTRDNRWPGKKIQILKLKLYPRRSGKVLIPSLSIKNISSNEKLLHIINDKTGEPELFFSTKTPYQRQQTIALLSVNTSEENSRLTVKEGQTIKNVDSTPLQFKRIKNTNGTYNLQIGWAISALKKGPLTLNFPPVEYSVSGVLRKKFYLPIKKISIKALPVYLPPTIPVGKITIHSKLPDKLLLKTDSLSYWNITISGKTNNTYNLPPVLRKIKDNQHIHFLPANTLRSVKVSKANLISVVEYSIPFKPLKNGSLTLPAIKIQYFNPENGKIITLIHKSTNKFVLSMFWQVLLLILGGLLLISLFIKARKHWQQLKYSKQKREEALYLLQKNKNIESIRKSIQLLAEAENWPTNTTISQWAKFWKSKYKVESSFEYLIEQLSSLLYSSKNNISKKNISQQILALVNNRVKR